MNECMRKDEIDVRRAKKERTKEKKKERKQKFPLVLSQQVGYQGLIFKELHN
jgi:hypothetical protein